MNKDFAVVILDELHGFSDIKKIHKQDTGLALGTSIDNALDNVNLFFIFTANSTDNLPDTLRSRVASHTITIGLPNQEEKEKSIKFRMADELKEGTINEQLIATIARECNDCSHRDLEFLSKRIRSLICDHHVELTPGVIQHAVQILKIDSPSEKQESESWEKRFYNDHPIAANPATYGLLLSAGSMILSGGQWLFSTGKVVCEKAGEHKDAIDKIAEAAALTAASGASTAAGLETTAVVATVATGQTVTAATLLGGLKATLVGVGASVAAAPTAVVVGVPVAVGVGGYFIYRYCKRAPKEEKTA